MSVAAGDQTERPAGRLRARRRAGARARRGHRLGHVVLLGHALLPAAKRKAMYAIYAFCREVDDVADGDAPVAAKLDQLAAWRREIDALFEGRPSRPTTLALLDPVARFDLPASEFHAMIDGMEMDANDSMRAPPLERADPLLPLRRRRRGASVNPRVRRAGRGGAARRLALGEALQLTTSCAIWPRMQRAGRLYLPRELLQQHRITRSDPISACMIPACPRCATGGRAGRTRLLMPSATGHGDRRALRPALGHDARHWRTLDRLIGRGWRQWSIRCVCPGRNGCGWRCATDCSETNGRRPCGRGWPRRARRGRRLASGVRPVAVYEAAQQAGGRSRSFFDRALGQDDNGNHLLVSGNRSALAYLDAIGASDGLIGPADMSFQFLDLRTGERWVVRPNAGPCRTGCWMPSRRVPERAWALISPLGGLARRRAADHRRLPAHDDELWRRFWALLPSGAQHAKPRWGRPSCSGPRCGRASPRAPPAAGPGRAHQPRGEPGRPGPAFPRAAGVALAVGQRLRAIGLEHDRANWLDFGQRRIELAQTTRSSWPCPPVRPRPWCPVSRCRTPTTPS